jgi:hypothetical protein
MRKENQNNNQFKQTTQSNTFNESKNKSKPKKLLNVNEKFVLSNQQVQEKHQTLNSQPIPGSQRVRCTQLYKEERMTKPTKATKRKSSFNGKKTQKT